MVRRRDTSPLRPVPATPQQQETHDAREFRQPIKDEHGHSGRLFFRVYQPYVREATEIIASKHFNYSTISDLLRHAFARHIRWLSGQMVDGVRRLGWMEAVTEILRSEEESLAYNVALDKMRKVIRDLQRQGADGRVRQLLNRVIGSIKKDMADDYWKDRYLEKIQNEFGHLLKGKHKVSLNPNETSDEGGDDE